MKLSVTIAENAAPMAPFIFRGDLSANMRKAAEIGYDAVELHIRDPLEVDGDKVEQSCLTHDIRVSSIGTGLGYGVDRLSLSASDAEIRKRAVERVHSHIRFAKRFDSLVIIGLLKGLVKETGSYEQYERDLIYSLNRCIELAEKENVVIVLEAINRFESDAMTNIGSTIDFIRKFDTDKLKLHIDTFHINIEETDIYRPIIEAKDFLGHVHFADNNRKHPGNGFFDFSRAVQALRDISYSGAIAMECLPLPTQDEAAGEAYRYTSALLK